VLYATAMGWLEGVVVVYLRALLGILPGSGYPGGIQTIERMAQQRWLIPVEQTREVATIVMLATAAWLSGRAARSRFGAFLVCFGIWDIVYYATLRVLIGWPQSLATMDLLFLIPQHPWWYQPVFVPVVISAFMIAGGGVLFIRDFAARQAARSGAVETPL